MPTTDLPLKGAIQQPQDMQQQSFAPAVQQQYPQELGTNPMVRQAYDLTQEASQRVRQNMQQSNNTGGTQQLIDNTLNYLYAAAPSKDQFEQDFHAARQAHNEYGQLVQKAQQLAAQPHTGQRMALALSALIPGVLGKAARAYTGASANKTQTELGRALQDLQTAKLQVADSDAVAKRDWDLYKDLIESGTKASTAKREALASGARVASEAAGIGAHYLGLAKAPGEMAHTAQQIETSKSQQKLNEFNIAHGGPEAKIESEKLGNQLKQKELQVKEKELGKPEPLDEGTKAEIDYQKFLAKHHTATADAAVKSIDTEIANNEQRINSGLEKRPEVIAKAKQHLDELKAKREQLINEGKAQADAALAKVHELTHTKAQTNSAETKKESHSSPQSEMTQVLAKFRASKDEDEKAQLSERYKELNAIVNKGK